MIFEGDRLFSGPTQMPAAQCWASVADSEPTLVQPWVNVTRLLG